LNQVNYGGFVSFAGMAEPFLNSDCAKMIRFAYEKGYKILLYSTFEFMMEKDWHLIKDIDFFSIVIHVADIQNNAKFILNFDYAKKIEKVIKRFPDSMISCHGEYHPTIKAVVGNRVNTSEILVNRAGNLNAKIIEMENLNLKFYTPLRLSGRIMCGQSNANGGVSQVLHTMLPDGTIILCCNDYSLTHRLGNLLNQTWDEISRSSEYENLKIALLDESSSSICRLCHMASEKRESGPQWPLIPPFYQMLRYKYLIELENIMDSLKDFPHMYGLLKILQTYENICIFGMGKLFNDTYFQGGWDVLIKANIFSDNRLIEVEEYNGIKCLPPKMLIDINSLLVISFISNYDYAHRSLLDIGIMNVMSIFDIVNILNR
jgi:hypothetical protein